MEKSVLPATRGGEANSFSNIIIGKNRHGGAKYHGTIDDVYIYNRAINDAEVARLFDSGLEDSDGDGLTDDYEIGKSRYKLVSEISIGSWQRQTLRKRWAFGYNYFGGRMGSRKEYSR